MGSFRWVQYSAPASLLLSPARPWAPTLTPHPSWTAQRSQKQRVRRALPQGIPQRMDYCTLPQRESRDQRERTRQGQGFMYGSGARIRTKDLRARGGYKGGPRVREPMGKVWRCPGVQAIQTNQVCRAALSLTGEASLFSP